MNCLRRMKSLSHSEVGLSVRVCQWPEGACWLMIALLELPGCVLAGKIRDCLDLLEKNDGLLPLKKVMA